MTAKPRKKPRVRNIVAWAVVDTYGPPYEETTVHREWRRAVLDHRMRSEGMGRCHGFRIVKLTGKVMVP